MRHLELVKIHHKDSIASAFKRLNANPSGILFVTDGNERVLGAVSDGGGIMRSLDAPMDIKGSIIAANTTLRDNPDLQTSDANLTVNYSLIGVADGFSIMGGVGNQTGTTANPFATTSKPWPKPRRRSRCPPP